METVIIVIHLMVILALIAVVLLQRSEGGALGIGGGNAFLSSRGQGNVLTRATGILAAAFFATSIALTVVSRLTAPPSAILDTVPAAATAPTTAPVAGTATKPASPTTGGILNQLNQYLNSAAPSTAPTPQNGATVPTGTATSPAPTGGTTTPSPATGTTTPLQVPTTQ